MSIGSVSSKLQGYTFYQQQKISGSNNKDNIPKAPNVGQDQNKIGSEKLGRDINKANGVVQLQNDFNNYLDFSIDDKTKELVVKVVNRNTKEVIRQIPPDETLKLIAYFDKITGVIFSKKI